MKVDNKSSARLIFNKKQRKIISKIIIIILYLLLLFPRELFISIFLISNILSIGSFLSKSLLFIIGIKKRNIPEINYQSIDENHLPIYTILVPVYKEDNIITNLLIALNNIDYPKDKLDIKLIAEEDDHKTIDAINKNNIDKHFHLIKVPYSNPRTKAKACNYALKSAKGRYITIYDAEDIPDIYQLKKSVVKFYNAKGDVICLQAKLNFYNKYENILTKLCSIEYLIWFDFILPSLELLNIPIPLGGTSNHFIKDKLVEIGGWDSYNVTEDADLGVRIAKYGYITEILNSYTLEESPIQLNIWFKQRARWIKGYIQTYLVHMRNPRKLYEDLGYNAFIGVQFFIGVFTLNFILAPFSLVTWIFYMYNDVISNIPEFILFLWYVNLIINLITIIKIFIAISITKLRSSIMIILLYPIYFILISLASFRSMYQLIVKPYHWDKTIHGISKYRRNL